MSPSVAFLNVKSAASVRTLCFVSDGAPSPRDQAAPMGAKLSDAYPGWVSSQETLLLPRLDGPRIRGSAATVGRWLPCCDWSFPPPILFIRPILAATPFPFQVSRPPIACQRGSRTT